MGREGRARRGGEEEKAGEGGYWKGGVEKAEKGRKEGEREKEGDEGMVGRPGEGGVEGERERKEETELYTGRKIQNSSFVGDIIAF